MDEVLYTHEHSTPNLDRMSWREAVFQPILLALIKKGGT